MFSRPLCSGAVPVHLCWGGGCRFRGFTSLGPGRPGTDPDTLGDDLFDRFPLPASPVSPSLFPPPPSAGSGTTGIYKNVLCCDNNLLARVLSGRASIAALCRWRARRAPRHNPGAHLPEEKILLDALPDPLCFLSPRRNPCRLAWDRALVTPPLPAVRGLGVRWPYAPWCASPTPAPSGPRGAKDGIRS